MDVCSRSSLSFVSWATNVTKCSNPTFEKVVSRAWNNPELQKDVLAVLTGVTKLIHDKGGAESAAEYYAALLLICLGRLLRAQARESWSLESVRHIYRYILRFIDCEKPTIRKSSHVAVCNILHIASSGGTDENVFHPACHQTVQHICVSIRREMRKLVAVLNTKDVHCVRLLHCTELLASILHLLPSKEVKAAAECILELVEFPNQLVVCKAFDSFRVLFDSRPSLVCLPVDLSARLLTALYTYKPNDPAIFDVASAVGDSHTTGVTGLDVMLAWIYAVRSGCAHLCEIVCRAVDCSSSEDHTSAINQVGVQRLAVEHLDRLLKDLLDLLASTPLSSLREKVVNIVDNVFVNELDSQLVTANLKDEVASLLLNTVGRLDVCLKLQRYETWVHALCLSARLLRIWPKVFPVAVAGGSIEPNLCLLIQHVAQLRDSLIDGPRTLTNLIEVNADKPPGLTTTLVDDRLGELIIDELDRVCLVALESLGPELVLSQDMLPLEPIVEELEHGLVELRRSWILSILARVQPINPSCRLAFFAKHILPLADRSLAVANRAAASKLALNSALVTASIAVCRQLWTSLSMFVRHAPSDWSELSSGGLGRRLTNALAHVPALRSIVLNALRRLALFAQEDEVGLRVMRCGAKLVVPVMLSLYENTSLPKDGALQQQLRSTLMAYLPCLTPKMIASPTTLALQKLESTQNPIFLELLQILIPHNPAHDIEVFLPKLSAYLSHTNCSSKILQKRAYRLLEFICSGSTPSTHVYVESHLDELLTLLHNLSNAEPEMLVVNPTATCPATTQPADQMVDRMANLSFAGVVNLDIQRRQKTKKKMRYRVPWKPRLRCLYHLLEFLVAVELADQNQVYDGPPESAVENPRLRQFANMFLPEILAAVCEANSVVRQLANRLVFNLVMAFAGQSSSSATQLQFPHDHQSDSLTMRSTFKSLTSANHTEDDEGEDTEDEKINDRASSIGRLTCADEDDLLSSRSMPRGGRISQNVCEALHLMLSRLWSCLPPQAAPPSNPGELNTQESAGRVVCYLLKQLRFRRALLFSLEADVEQPRRFALSILSDSLSAARHLISSAQRPLAQLGLQLVRLLLAFVGWGSVCLTELVQTLQSLHATQKRPLRFAVKTILEKMIKKFGRKTIQSMTSLEYQKVVRNSARIMARRDRRQRAEFGTVRELKGDDATSVKSKTGSLLSRRCRPSGAPSVSGRSHISLPPRVHVPRFEELLAASSDEEDHPDERKSTGSTRSGVSSRRSVKTATIRSKSLVEELESLAETTGLCRRSRQRVLRGSVDLADDIVERNTVAGTAGIRRKVRFADAASVASASRLEGKRSRKAHGTSQNSDLWLVEQPEVEDIVDLSDARALARHTAIATDAETARAITDTLRKTEVKASTRLQSDHTSPFPVVDGKIVIDGNVHQTDSGHIADQDWHLQDSDGEDSKPGVGAWSTQNQTRLVRSRTGKTAHARIPGQIYTSTKARGDMRRAGQPDPYAYIALGSGLGGAGKTATAVERRRLLRAVGLGKRKRAKNKNPSATRSGGIRRPLKKRAQRERK
ncbi:hypothetical protein P879_03470 [Paragonimus westermani]|uniref:RRP12 HEAT domain-containing protein n=1 Tax=Paragonimus westermani TaxID=34504 RepID=A0A8T0DMJ2_9TREM|nr:hypothetical protein P879_03470 [Paragonimus westermani]